LVYPRAGEHDGGSAIDELSRWQYSIDIDMG
jgi:hypothetical protein